MPKTAKSAQLRRFLERIDGAYAPNTIRAFRADFEEFEEYCKSSKRRSLPAAPQTIAEFIDSQISRGIRATTVKRKLVSLAAVHRLSDLGDPTKSSTVRISVRRMCRKLGAAYKQALPVTSSMLEKMLKATDNSLAGLRDRALLRIAYDTLARRSEIITLKFEDIEVSDDGAAIHLKQSKTDQNAEGRWLSISSKTLKAINAWSKAAKIESGYIIRAINRHGHVSDRRITPEQISRNLKKLALQAGLPQENVKRISGHSLRVGAAQDWARRGASLPQLMILGRWDKPDTVIRYIGGARLNVERLTLENQF
jgi:site-specific recombinase XerD